MPRDYDSDQWENDGRRGSSSGTKTVLIVLGIIGGLFVLGVLGCVGIAGWGIFNFQKQFTGLIATMTASEAFLSDLQGNRIDVAYASTSAAYQAKTSRKQFDEFLAEHPLLTKNGFHTQRTANLPMQGKTKSATFTYVLSESGTDDDDPDPDDPDAKPKANDAKKKDEKKKETPKSIVCTLVLIEENGKWVVDQFTVP